MSGGGGPGDSEAMLGSWDQHGGRTSATPAVPNLDGGSPDDDVRSELGFSAGEACPPDAGAYRSSVIRLLPGCAGLEINIKWPNDIYVNRKAKIGGRKQQGNNRVLSC